MHKSRVSYRVERNCTDTDFCDHVLQTNLDNRFLTEGSLSWCSFFLNPRKADSTANALFSTQHVIPATRVSQSKQWKPKLQFDFWDNVSTQLNKTYNIVRLKLEQLRWLWLADTHTSKYNDNMIKPESRLCRLMGASFQQSIPYLLAECAYKVPYKQTNLRHHTPARTESLRDVLSSCNHVGNQTIAAHYLHSQHNCGHVNLIRLMPPFKSLQ